MLSDIVAAARALPQFEPAIHMQTGLEIDQRPIHHRTLAVAEHAFSCVVGVAHVTVPIDPENAYSALIDGELAQTQRLFPRPALVDGFPCGQ